MIDDWDKYTRLGELVFSLVSAIIVNYLQLRFQVKQITKQINGLGAKLNALIEKQSNSNERVARIEGYLDFEQKNKHGNA